MKKVVELKCTNCGANISIEEKREYFFCQHCGTKLVLDNDKEQVYRHIDEADLKRAETEQLVKLKQLELEEKEKEQKAKITKLKIKISLVLCVCGILMMILGNVLGNLSGDSDSSWYLMSMLGFLPIMATFYLWIFSSEDKNK